MYPGAYPGPTTFPGISGLVGPLSGRLGAPTMRARDSLLVVCTAKSGAQVTRPAPADLIFSAVVPGGFDVMTCTLDWPPGWPPSDSLAIGSTAQVVDRRNGEVVWHGQVVDPGTRRSMGAPSQQITAQGFHRRLDFNGGPVAYVDRRFEMWDAGASFAAGQTTTTDDEGQISQNPYDWVDPTAAVIMQTIPEGAALGDAATNGMYVTYLHPRWSSSGQDITAVICSVDGINDLAPALEVNIRLWTQTRVTSNTPTVRAYSEIGATEHLRPYQGSPGWTMTNARQVDLVFRYTGGGTTSPRDYYAKWGNIAVMFSRLDRFGNLIDPLDTNLTIRDVIADVIGRWLLADYDISNALDPSTTLVPQAAWWEGVTARAVFEAMLDLDPTWFYAVWDPDRVGGKPRFEVIFWDREPRYIVPPGAAQLDLQGGGDELYNRCVIGYTSRSGVQATTVVVGTVPELTAAGDQRTLMLDVTGEGQMSETAAQNRGYAALSTADVQRTSGTAAVVAPIFDRKTGRMVMPWEIRPGHGIVFGEVQAIAANGHVFSPHSIRDGRSTFHLTGTSFAAQNGVCTLSLDGGGRTLWRKIQRVTHRM